MIVGLMMKKRCDPSRYILINFVPILCQNLLFDD